MKQARLWIIVVLAVCGLGILTSCALSGTAARQNDAPIRIGIAWRGDNEAVTYVGALQSVREAGAEPVPLPLLKAPFMEYDGDLLLPRYTDEHGVLLKEYAEKLKSDPLAGQNIDGLLADLDGIVFTGGSDISPTLYKTPEPWHGIESEGNCDGRRDVSDYILMTWCLKKEPPLPVLCLCRGMQMLAIVSGAQMIQDLSAYFAARNLPYAHEHRVDATADHGPDFAPHDVTITDDSSLLCSIMGSETISRVPSGHHQAVRSVKGTPLKVTAVAKTSGLDIIEAVERTDKPFFIGIQYHPEASVAKHAGNAADASRFMDRDEALRCFRALVEQCGKQKRTK